MTVVKTNPDKPATAADFNKAVMETLNKAGWEFNQSNAREVINAVTTTAHEFFAEGEPVTIGGLVKLTPRYKPKQAAKTGVFFGEERKVAAKPASVVLKATFLKSAKDALPSTPARIKKIFG
jgi:nucleoid DNA-binding protein